MLFKRDFGLFSEKFRFGLSNTIAGKTVKKYLPCHYVYLLFR